MSAMNPPMPLRLQQPPLPLIGSHNEREPFLLCLHPNHWEIRPFSCSSPSSTSAPICFEWFPTQFVSGDHKNTVRFRIRDIYHPKMPACSRLPCRNTRAFLAWAILARMVQHIFDLVLKHLMPVNVGQASFPVNVEANLHSHSSIPSLPTSTIEPYL